jgi:hypothetical protein
VDTLHKGDDDDDDDDDDGNNNNIRKCVGSRTYNIKPALAQNTAMV